MKDAKENLELSLKEVFIDTLLDAQKACMVLGAWKSPKANWNGVKTLLKVAFEKGRNLR